MATRAGFGTIFHSSGIVHFVLGGRKASIAIKSLLANDNLNVRFGEIFHGWLPITFGIADTNTLVDASDVPTDPIATLVSLSRFLVSVELGSQAFEFHLEPEYCMLTATKAEDNETVIRLEQPGCDFAQFGLLRVATATQIWHAVRRIESAVRSAVASDHWSWDFPSAQVDMLATEIQFANSAH